MIRDYYEQWYANKLDSLEKNKFLEKATYAVGKYIFKSSIW